MNSRKKSLIYDSLSKGCCIDPLKISLGQRFRTTALKKCKVYLPTVVIDSNDRCIVVVSTFIYSFVCLLSIVEIFLLIYYIQAAVQVFNK